MIHVNMREVIAARPRDREACLRRKPSESAPEGQPMGSPNFFHDFDQPNLAHRAIIDPDGRIGLRNQKPGRRTRARGPL